MGECLKQPENSIENIMERTMFIPHQRRSLNCSTHNWIDFQGEIMKLNIPIKQANTKTVQFRIDPETSKMLTKLRSHYGTTSGVLLKEMIKETYKSVYKKEQT